MNQPEQIVRTLDRHLTQPVRLILYGRAALALGYPASLPAFHATMDVDAILPEVEMAAIEADDSFWEAIEKTNDELEASGLYLTLLFTDSQVILRPDWLDHVGGNSLGRAPPSGTCTTDHRGSHPDENDARRSPRPRRSGFSSFPLGFGF